jgi:uncharacterized membrane protein
MAAFLYFLIISILFGPGMAISYGLENPPFNPAGYLSILLIIEAFSIALVYLILRFLPTQVRFENYLLDKVAIQIHGSREAMVKLTESVTQKFTQGFGHIGFYLGLALISFAYGPYIAAIIAYFIRVRLNRAMISIAAGAAVSIVFWWYLANGAIPFVTPTLIFVVITGASAAFFVYGWFREKQVVDKISKSMIKSGLDIGEHTRKIQKQLKETKNIAHGKIKQGKEEIEKNLKTSVDKARKGIKVFEEHPKTEKK